MIAPPVTVCVCILNEAESIRPLIESIRAQTLSAAEILIVDGGSTDGTLDILHEYEGRELRLRVVLAPGTNIAQARNVAFEQAKNDLIASIDGGCVARPNWLQQLVAQLSDDVDIVSGAYVADPSNTWEGVMEEFFYPDFSKLPDNWKEPSHSSVLIRKLVWESIGPIPQNLYRSEDSWFNAAAARRGFRFRTARDALVYRRPRQDLKEVFRNTSVWVKSDIENDVNMPFELRRAARITLRLSSKVLVIALWALMVMVSPVSGVIALPLAASHLVTVKWSMKSIRHFVLYNLVDYAVMIASSYGLMSGVFRRVSRVKMGPG